MSNIILIGMPGCGKTTIGKKVADKLGKKFVDTDELLVEIYNKEIPEIFAEEGEEKFREYETETLKSIDKDLNAVIATGGGIVVKERNVPLMKQLGKVFFIDREVEDILSTLDSDSRPLLADDRSRIYNLYEDRYEKYKSACDIIVNNDMVLEKVVDSIISKIEEV